MTEFEREWAAAEREQHARLLYQLKREIVAKRQAEAAQVSLQHPAPSTPSATGAALLSAPTPTAPARPIQKRLNSPSKPLSSGRWE